MVDEKKVYELLKRLGISPSNKGYYYTKTAVLNRLEAEEMGEKQNIGDSYRQIMEECNVSYVSAERNIRFVNQKMFTDATKDTLPFVKEVFGTTDFITNGTFIALLCEYLKFN